MVSLTNELHKLHDGRIHYHEDTAALVSAITAAACPRFVTREKRREVRFPLQVPTVFPVHKGQAPFTVGGGQQPVAMSAAARGRWAAGSQSSRRTRWPLLCELAAGFSSSAWLMHKTGVG